jgi:ribosomal protein L37AE/L43A
VRLGIKDVNKDKLNMHETTVTQKKYVCDSCGAKHAERYNVWTDRLSGNDVCTKCAKKVDLIDRSIYDCGDDINVSDFGAKTKDVDSKLVTASELDLEYDYDVYKEQALKIRQLYMEQMDKLDLMYMSGNVREYKI